MARLKGIKSYLPYILALVFLTVVHLFYFFNPRLPAHDITSTYYPIAEKLKISIFDYKDLWPLWDPYGFSGTLFLMLPYLGPDSLLGFLVLILPRTIIALKLTYVLLFLISGFSMYSLMIYLKLNKKFAFVSALAYILNAHMSKLLSWGWLTTLGGYALLPLAFLFGMKAVKEKFTIKNPILAGIIFSLLFRFNPDMKVTMWFGIIFGFYLIFDFITKPTKKNAIKILIVGLMIFLVFFGLSAHRIIPNMESIKLTSRGVTDWKIAGGRRVRYGELFSRLIEPIYKGMPKIRRVGTGDHIGIVAFILVLFSLYKKYKNKNVLFFGFIALFSIFAATNTFNIYYLLWRFFPFFKSLRYMDRSLFLFSFSCSIVAGFGAEEFFRKIKRHKNMIYIILILLLIIDLGIFNYSPYTGGDPKKWPDAEKVIKSNHILQSISKKQGWFRIQTWETRGIDWGTDFYNVPLRLEHIYKYTPMWHPPYMNVYLAVALNNPAKFWGILNVKYITSQKKINVSGFRFIKKFKNCSICWSDTPLAKAWGPYLYENERFLPRAYIVNNSILVVGEKNSVRDTIYALMLNKEFRPSKQVIIRGKKSINEYDIEELNRFKVVFLTMGSVDENSIFKLKQYVDHGGILVPDITKGENTIATEEINNLLKSMNGTLTQIDDKSIIMHNFDRREIKLEKKYRGFLVYSEKFSVFPGWKARSNGKEKKIYNADMMISSIYLEGNEKDIVFEYKPKSYMIGVAITMVTLILVLLYFLRGVFKKHKNLNMASDYSEA